jgi:hypothetical protein
MKLSTRSPKDHGWRYKLEDIEELSKNLVNYLKNYTQSEEIKELSD